MSLSSSRPSSTQTVSTAASCSQCPTSRRPSCRRPDDSANAQSIPTSENIQRLLAHLLPVDDLSPISDDDQAPPPEDPLKWSEGLSPLSSEEIYTNTTLGESWAPEDSTTICRPPPFPALQYTKRIAQHSVDRHLTATRQSNAPFPPYIYRQLPFVDGGTRAARAMSLPWVAVSSEKASRDSTAAATREAGDGGGGFTPAGGGAANPWRDLFKLVMRRFVPARLLLVTNPCAAEAEVPVRCLVPLLQILVCWTCRWVTAVKSKEGEEQQAQAQALSEWMLGTAHMSHFTSRSWEEVYEQYSRKRSRTIHWIEPDLFQACETDTHAMRIDYKFRDCTRASFEELCSCGGKEYAETTSLIALKSQLVADLLASHDERCIQCEKHTLLPIFVCHDLDIQARFARLGQPDRPALNLQQPSPHVELKAACNADDADASRFSQPGVQTTAKATDRFIDDRSEPLHSARSGSIRSGECPEGPPCAPFRRMETQWKKGPPPKSFHQFAPMNEAPRAGGAHIWTDDFRVKCAPNAHAANRSSSNIWAEQSPKKKFPSGRRQTHRKARRKHHDFPWPRAEDGHLQNSEPIMHTGGSDCYHAKDLGGYLEFADLPRRWGSPAAYDPAIVQVQRRIGTDG